MTFYDNVQYYAYENAEKWYLAQLNIRERKKIIKEVTMCQHVYKNVEKNNNSSLYQTHRPFVA